MFEKAEMYLQTDKIPVDAYVTCCYGGEHVTAGHQKSMDFEPVAAGVKEKRRHLVQATKWDQI